MLAFEKSILFSLLGKLFYKPQNEIEQWVIHPGFIRAIKEKLSQPSYISKDNNWKSAVYSWSIKSGFKNPLSCYLRSLSSGEMFHGHGDGMSIAKSQVSNQLRHLVMKGGPNLRNKQLE